MDDRGTGDAAEPTGRASEDGEIIGILAFEEERVRSWKRRSNALLAALRRHHPERDPRREQPRCSVSQKTPSSARVNAPTRPSRLRSSDSGKTPIDAAGDRPPVSDAAMRSAHLLLDGQQGRPRAGEHEAAGSMDLAHIKKAVCRYYNVQMNELLSHRRQAHLTRARHVGMYLAKLKTGRSFPDIGRHFGDRDHTTVLHAVRKIEADRESYDDEIADISAALT